MNRKKNFLLILLALVLTFTMSFSLFACKRDTGSQAVVEDVNALLANGSFVTADGEYPKMPTGWTSAAGSTDSNKGTPAVQGQDIKTGVISVDAKTYKDHAKDWMLANVPNPGTPNANDTNVLMINNLVPTAYRYTSSSVNIEKNTYYEVKVNVRTDATAKAFIYVRGDAYAEFKGFNSGNNWQSYTLYIEGATDAARSISIDIANGWGDKVNGTMSQGVVFFDDIKVTKLDDATAYNNALANPADNISTYSMKQSDTEFNYTSGATMPYSAVKYRGYAGYSNSGDNAYSSSTYVSHGIIDTTISNDKKAEIGFPADLTITAAENAAYSKMLFINNKKMTAYGYRASVPFLLEAGKTYKFSAYVRTVDVSSKGATIKFVEGSDDYSNTVKMSGINTNGEWEKKEFIVSANQLVNKSVYLELWLGEGGLNDKDNKDKGWAKGTVFMDKISFEEVTDATPTYSYADVIDNEQNFITNGFVMKDGTNNNDWDVMPDLEFDNGAIARHETMHNVTNDMLPSNTDIMFNYKEGQDPVRLSDLVKISIDEPSAYGFVIDNKAPDKPLTVYRNHYYEFSMWVKTDLADKYEGKGLNIRLMQKKAENADEDEKDKVIASFNNINTSKVEMNNGYVKVIFYVEGSKDADFDLYLDVMLGSGTKYTPETLVDGSAYITLVSMKSISHDDYTKTSSATYSKKSSLTTSAQETSTIANTNFNSTDINATYDNYLNYQGKKTEQEDEESYDEKVAKFISNDEANMGEFIKPTAPTSWSISNKAYLEALTTGIISNEAQYNSIFAANSEIDRDGFGSDVASFLGSNNKSALVIATKKVASKGVLTVPTSPDTCGCEKCKAEGKDVCSGGEGHNCLHNNPAGVLPVGYVSQSISLSANSYYLVKAQVKVGMVGDSSANANIYIDSDSDNYISVGNTNGEWQEVAFYINTGLSSTSIKLELYLGTKGDKAAVEGLVAFDNTTCTKIEKEQYDNVITDSHTKTISLIKDTFKVDNPSDTALSTPSSDWSGAAAKDAPATDSDVAKGVFDQIYTSREWLKTTNTEGVTTIIDNGFYTNSLMKSDNKNFLVINNIVPTAYSYTNSGSSKMFAVNGFYEVSVDVLTFGLKAEQNAYISLKLNEKTYVFDNDDAKSIKVNTSTYADGVETAGTWTTYTFLVKTPDKTAINNVTITLGLGKVSDDENVKDKNYVQGYAFFDNVSFKQLYTDKESVEDKTAAFDAEVESGTKMKVAATNEELLETPKDETVAPPAEPKNNLMWLYITSGVIGGLIIIVVIGVLLKKYWPRISASWSKNKAKNMTEYDKNNTSKDNKNGRKSDKEFKD